MPAKLKYKCFYYSRGASGHSNISWCLIIWYKEVFFQKIRWSGQLFSNVDMFSSASLGAPHW